MRNLIFITSFILISLAVGVLLGFSRAGTPKAFAKGYPQFGEKVAVFPAPGIDITPVGSRGEINNKISQLFSFTSGLSIGDIMELQEKRWKEIGLKTSKKASPERGVLIGVNKDTREFFQMMAFFCPPTIRGKLCAGQNAFGIISKMVDEMSSNGAPLPFQICSGGRELSSYAATDLGHPSITSTYICPSSPESVASELDTEFVMWQKKEDTSDVIVYYRDGEEITIIPSGKDSKTLLVVTYQRGV